MNVANVSGHLKQFVFGKAKCDYSGLNIYLRELLCDPNLTVWMIINLEAGWLLATFSVAPGDNSLTSSPIEVHLWVNI